MHEANHPLRRLTTLALTVCPTDYFFARTAQLGEIKTGDASVVNQ
jgi:hypothetical protein